MSLKVEVFRESNGGLRFKKTAKVILLPYFLNSLFFFVIKFNNLLKYIAGEVNIAEHFLPKPEDEEYGLLKQHTRSGLRTHPDGHDTVELSFDFKIYDRNNNFLGTEKFTNWWYNIIKYLKVINCQIFSILTKKLAKTVNSAKISKKSCQIWQFLPKLSICCPRSSKFGNSQ